MSTDMERMERADNSDLGREMGAPDYLSALQAEQLQSASRMAREPHGWKYEAQTVQLEIELPPHALAAVTVEFASERHGGGSER